MQQAEIGFSTGSAFRSAGKFNTITAPAGGVVSFRKAIEDRIERMIAILDHLDGDSDVEFNGDEFECEEGQYWLGSVTATAIGQNEDDEHDFSIIGMGSYPVDPMELAA